MTIHHRPGDPRTEPRLSDDCPGCGIARAVLFVLAAVVALVIWSVL